MVADYDQACSLGRHGRSSNLSSPPPLGYHQLRNVNIACNAYNACVIAVSQTEIVLRKAQLEFSDFVLLKPTVVAEKLRRTGIKERDVVLFQCKLARKALSDPNFSTEVINGLRESVIDSLKVLITARLAGSCKELKPTISGISEFSDISRNKVSPIIDSLEQWDFVSTKCNRKELLVFVTANADMGIDAISGNFMDETSALKEISSNIEKQMLSEADIKFLENMENAFRFAESAYDKNTLNYDVMHDLHDQSMNLLVQAKDNNCNLESFHKFTSLLNEIAMIKKEARDKELKPAILEKNGEKLGRAIVYRIR